MKKTIIGTLVAGVVAAAAVLLSQSPPSGGRDDIAVVRVGILPDEDEAGLRKHYSPLLAHLARETGLKFQLTIPQSYRHLLRLFVDRKVDLAYFGGLTFVKGLAFHGASPLVMRDVDIRFTSYFVVRADGPLRDCQDLNCAGLPGKVISFGPKLSTSGHLMPRHFMKTFNAIEPEKYFGAVRYSGAHDKTAYQVRDGEVDLGVINSQIYNAMERDGRLRRGELRVIWETPPYADNVWAVQDDLGEGVKTSLRNAFLMLGLDNRDHAEILSDLGAGSFLPAGASDFKALQEFAQGLGMLTAEKP